MAKEASADLGLVNTGGHPNACIDVIVNRPRIDDLGPTIPIL